MLLVLFHRPKRDFGEISRESVCPVILHQSESVLDYEEEEEDEKNFKDIIKIGT